MHDDGKVLLITGGSSGIGEATARRALAEGWRVVIAARHRDRLGALVDELGEDALAVSCDVRDYQQQHMMVEQALKHFGRLDGLFANAGIASAPGGFSEADPESWREMLLTNVYGVACSIRAALPALKRQRGHVLITGSAAGRAVIPGSMYGAGKWAVSAIGYNLREELRGSGVRVTLVEPGYVRTPLLDNAPPQALEPEDVAAAVFYALQQPEHVDVNEILLRPTPPQE